APGFSQGSSHRLTTFGAARQASTIGDIYQQRLQSYGLAAAPAGPGTPFARLRFDLSDPRGREIDASSATNIIVDSSPPTSTLSLPIDPLTRTACLRGPGGASPTLTIGGNAEDNIGVPSVQLSVNGGSWQPTSGGPTWAFNLPAAEGSYTLQTRATDLAGNVETPGPAVRLLIDASAPALALDPPGAAALVPTRTVAGDWVVHLSG